MKPLVLCAVLGALSCSVTSPSRLPAAYEEVIRSEWGIAQNLLDSVGVSRTGLVPPEVCTWVPHDGPFKCGNREGCNGCFTPVTFVVRWNIHTPRVIRHEAGHAILHFLDHPCRSCWSVDLTVTLHTGCESTHCEAIL